ncbi:diiron oxygenase [Pseudonocardiaceae bacterium YIM PH 21723]|nr:diiron oxygenase [Pseudonocardiaceae bacterium YIM PH 21723]
MARLTAIADYETELRTLSEGSVNVHLDPFADIDWDSAEMVIDPKDPRWILPASDPLAGTDWYRNLPQDRQIEVGLWRWANVAKVGLQFEAILIRGMMQWVMTLPNQSAEFRYSLHEVTEECNHIQMFQELVNRMDQPAPGMSPVMRAASPAISFLAAYFPMIFFIGILAGEEPIDHVQKSAIRSDANLPPVLKRIFQIHIAEEARHISYAHKFLTENLKSAGRVRRLALGLALPIAMRWLADVIMSTPPEFRRTFDVPRKALRQAFWKSPQSQQLMRDFFPDVRQLGDELGLRNNRTLWLWRLLKIDGPTSRYRSEPNEYRRSPAVA